MDMLYNKTQTRTDTYYYEINGGGELCVKESGKVKIVFENKKFVLVSYPLTGTYTRNGWRILAAINEKIDEIEQALKDNEELSILGKQHKQLMQNVTLAIDGCDALAKWQEENVKKDILAIKQTLMQGMREFRVQEHATDGRTGPPE